jgi:hypothetical protein
VRLADGFAQELVARMKMQMQDEDRIELLVTSTDRIVADPFQQN